MRALIVALSMLVAGVASAQTSSAPQPSGAAPGGPSPPTSSPADPSGKSYVNPQATEAPANDDNRNPNYQTPAGSRTTDPDKASGADGSGRRRAR